MGFSMALIVLMWTVFALLEILQQPLPKSGELVLKSLLIHSGRKVTQIYALRSPFETKDILKARAIGGMAKEVLAHYSNR